MLLKVMLAAIAVGLLLVARAFRQHNESRKAVRNRRERWSNWADEEAD
jgi:hypothetical protein